jgi:DNA repair exonuclease SbcCD ATPase subunit/energy-coupling factor transporter ATP-binding protein EcfA2
MNFHNARDFDNVVLYFNKNGAETESDIVNNHEEHVLIGGLNGTGKSTIASAFMCILNAPDNDASPEDLISSHKDYTSEEQWIFKGAILFYNDGALEDYSQYIKIVARFRGYSRSVSGIKRPYIEEKIFEIYDSDSLAEIENVAPLRFSNTQKYHPLKDYDAHLDKLGISPKKYLLYWKQGATNKFTAVKHAERFDKFAAMLGLDKKISRLDLMEAEQARRRNDLDKLSLGLERLGVERQKVEVDAENKKKRDNILKRTIGELINISESLWHFADKEVLALTNTHGILCREISALNMKNEELTESYNELKETLGSLVNELELKEKERIETDEAYARLKEEVEEISGWLSTNEPIYKEIKELISELQRENLIESKELSIDKVATLVKKLNEEISELQRIIKENKEKDLDTKINLEKDKLMLKNVEEKISELRKKVIIAENVIDESPKDYELITTIESLENEIKKSNYSIEELNKDKEKILAAVASYLYLLKESKGDIEKRIETVVADQKEVRSEIEIYENDKNRAEKQLAVCMSKLEGLSLENLREQLTLSENAYIEQSENLQTTSEKYSEYQLMLHWYNKSLDKSIPIMKSQSALLNERLISLRAKNEDKEIDLPLRIKQKDELSADIREFPHSVEEYEDEITLMQAKENDISLEINMLDEKKKAALKELDSFMEGLFRNVEEEPEWVDAYHFYDIFQIVSRDLEESKKLEKRLALIKDAIFVNKKLFEINPQSDKYHIPLKEFKGYSGPLPFGLVLNDDLPEYVALRACEWLKSIENYIDENGAIKDIIGIRGVKEEKNPALILNKILKEWTIRNMEENIEGYSGNINKLSEELITIRKEKGNLINACDTLKTLNKDFRRISNDITDIEKEIELLKRDMQDRNKEKVEIDNYLNVLDPIHDNIVLYKDHLMLNSMENIEYTNDEIIEAKENIREIISTFKSTIEEMEELSKNINAGKRDIERLQEQITTFIKNSDESLVIRNKIENLDASIKECSNKLEVLALEMAESEKAERALESNISNIEKYFGNVSENATDIKYELKELLAKTSDIYTRHKLPLNDIETKMKETIRGIGTSKERLDENYKILEKVMKANEELKARDEITVLEGNREELSTNIIGLEVLEKYQLKVIENDEKKLEEKQLSREHFQGYLNKWEEVNWDLYENFNSKEKRKNDINSQLVPLGEKSRELFKATFDIRVRQGKIETEKNKLLSDMENLTKSISLKITEKIETESKLEFYKNHQSYSFSDTEEYRQQAHLSNFERLMLSDYLPMLEMRYMEKFSVAIEEGYAKDYRSFVSELNISLKDIENEEEFKSEVRGMKTRLSYIFDVLREDIKEDSEKKLRLVNEQYERTKDEKESVEKEVSRNESLVNDSKREVEGSIHSAVRITVAVLMDKLDKLGYIVKLNYRPKEGNTNRQLELFFEKSVYGSDQLREIKSDDGMSGGEHAAISLMIMYAIMKVKEKIDGGGNKQGGYLLLDEWDANLDPINSRIIFGFLEELGKKIISITPRSSYEEYIDKFGVLIRVANVGKRPMVAMINKTDDKQIKEMIDEAKSAES